MAIWCRVPRAPRRLVGAISPTYMGVRPDAKPAEGDRNQASKTRNSYVFPANLRKIYEYTTSNKEISKERSVGRSPQKAPMMNRPRIIISKEWQSLASPIRLPPMKAKRLLMSMAFLLENTHTLLRIHLTLRCRPGSYVPL